MSEGESGAGIPGDDDVTSKRPNYPLLEIIQAGRDLQTTRMSGMGVK